MKGRTDERAGAGGYRIMKQCSPFATALRSVRRRRAGQIRGKSAGGGRHCGGKLGQHVRVRP